MGSRKEPALYRLTTLCMWVAFGQAQQPSHSVATENRLRITTSATVRLNAILHQVLSIEIKTTAGECCKINSSHFLIIERVLCASCRARYKYWCTPSVHKCQNPAIPKLYIAHILHKQSERQPLLRTARHLQSSWAENSKTCTFFLSRQGRTAT